MDNNLGQNVLRREVEREKRLRLRIEDGQFTTGANSAFGIDLSDETENVGQVRARYRNLLAYTEQLWDEHRSVISSRSWRITKPYRYLGRVIHRLRRGKFAAQQKSILDLGPNFLAPAGASRRLEGGGTEDALHVDLSVRTAGSPTGRARQFDVDVCIVTTCRFPGGNTSSTLDEIQTFTQAGLTVLLVHIPLSPSPKVSERYAPHLDKLVHVDDVTDIKCRVLIARAPRVIVHDKFEQLANRVQCQQAVFVINNSAYRPDGTPTFDWQQLTNVVHRLPWADKQIHPLGPAIRQEAEGHGVEGLAEYDWGPTFAAGQLPFEPRSTLVKPYVIGRHGRDGPEKWLDSREALLGAYPDNPEFRISIMGGANNALNILRDMPANWKVYPFGSLPVADYLSGLDVFVYFPHENLNEAFGRTIMEAMFSGIPCVLPPRMKQTFGNFAFYCNPLEVRHVVDRLASPASDEMRLRFVIAVRDEMVSRYESSSLFRRLPLLQGNEEHPQPTDLGVELLQFRAWVEKGGNADL